VELVEFKLEATEKSYQMAKTLLAHKSDCEKGEGIADEKFAASAPTPAP